MAEAVIVSTARTPIGKAYRGGLNDPPGHVLGAHAIAGQATQVACDSNRIWKVLGCGGLYLGAWQPGSDDFARGGEHCVWYRGADEAVALAERYLALPRERAEIAAAGREHALQHHTYQHRLTLLLEGRGHTMV